MKKREKKNRIIKTNTQSDLDGDQVTQEPPGRGRDEAQGARKRETQARVKAGTRHRAKGEADCGAEEICSTMAGSSRSSGSCGEARRSGVGR